MWIICEIHSNYSQLRGSIGVRNAHMFQICGIKNNARVAAIAATVTHSNHANFIQ